MRGRQQHLIRQIVQGGARQRVIVQQARDDDQAVQINAMFGRQMLCQTAAPDAAVAFTGDELGRGPALLTRQPKPHELRHRADVLCHAQELPELLRIFRMAEARIHRIDEDEVRAVQQRELVGHQIARWLRRGQAISR